MRNNKIDRPIFMIGMPRSGTTIISEAIAMHEELGWFSNLQSHIPSIYLIALLSRLTATPVIGEYLRGKKKQSTGLASKIRDWLPHFDETYSIWEHYLGKKFSKDYLIDQQVTMPERSSVERLIKNVLICQGKKRFYSKLTGPPRIHYLNSIFPDAFFLHIVRDPRAVVSSLLNVAFWKHGGLNKPWWQNGFPDIYIQEWIKYGKTPVALAALQWKWIIELTWREKESISTERYVEVRYEDFIKDPHYTIKDLFYRVGLEDSHAAHQYIGSTGKVYDMSQKYRSKLKDDEIKMIETITSTTAIKSGYIF